MKRVRKQRINSQHTNRDIGTSTNPRLILVISSRSSQHAKQIVILFVFFMIAARVHHIQRKQVLNQTNNIIFHNFFHLLFTTLYWYIFQSHLIMVCSAALAHPMTKTKKPGLPKRKESLVTKPGLTHTCTCVRVRQRTISS